MKYYLPMIEHLGLFVGRDTNIFTEKSYELIDKIYEAMECIKEVGHDEEKIIYVRYERGDFDSYTRFNRLKFKSKREYEEEYKDFLDEYYMDQIGFLMIMIIVLNFMLLQHILVL